MFVAIACIGVAKHHEEACVLEVHVGIGINKGISANVHFAGFGLLHCILVELRTEVWGFVFGKNGGRSTNLECQLTHEFEFQINIVDLFDYFNAFRESNTLISF